ncbi:hypothetical protein THOM_0314 [Trachipleistophora hominis]|uniref:Uncharacterized protein n=1 Tax=Trachipleistophora hominis TaxID=72359 RepID=L7JYT8_TRAHO|nr:hypothetical protein THOM_0314 [Trachipleistophora hominis]
MDIKKINKTIKLLKRCYNQPILFQILHNNLSFLIQNEYNFPFHLYPDMFSKILIASTSTQAYVNLDNKILAFLKDSRESVKYSVITRYKVKIILYYLINQPYDMFSKFICFEIINNYGNIPDLGYLVAHYIRKYALSNFFEVKLKKAMPIEYVDLYLQKNMGDSVDFKAEILPLCAIYSLKGISLGNFKFDYNLRSIILLESVTFYAKFTENVSDIKRVLPSNDNFVRFFKIFLNRNKPQNREIRDGDSTSLKELDYRTLMVYDNLLFKSLKEEFVLVDDKREYLNKLKEVVDELEKSFKEFATT